MRSLLRRFAFVLRRYYRVYPGRKRIQVETKIKSPKRYDELRGGSPTTLLQGNLFTPESAGPRELAMLCFRIVSMGYADASILLRYAQCAVKQIAQLRIKHIALVLHSISKFLAANATQMGQPSGSEVEAFQAEIANREQLLLTVDELVKAATPNLQKLFARAVPKDLGMIALSLVTVCECAFRELGADHHASLLGTTEQTLKLIATSIGPKLPFCEAPEYAALAKAFCKLPPQLEFAGLFLRDLADEVACLLLEKQEQLEELNRGSYIGDDLLESLMELPKDLTTIACALSRRVHRHRMWKRLAEFVELMLKVNEQGDGSFARLDGQTLILLATSLSRHADVGFLLNALLAQTAAKPRPQWLITGMDIALNALNDVDLGQRLWDSIDFAQVPALDDAAKTQLVHASMRVRNLTEEQKAVVRGLVSGDCSKELLVALYAARHRCGIDRTTQLLDAIMADVDRLGVSSLMTMLRNVEGVRGLPSGDSQCDVGENHDSEHVDGDSDLIGAQEAIKAQLFNALGKKVESVPLSKLYEILLYTIDNHGGRVAVIEKMAVRVGQAAAEYQDHHLATLIERLRGVGINPERVFETSLVERLQKDNGDVDPQLVDSFVEDGMPQDSRAEPKFSELGEFDFGKT
ncbi:hypothetical protein, conserved [Babesia bigemina]|uniref:Uncharacterized protein n=1 Tax=Babesia bigemina TaxID=5866 RepID=A0A061DCQ6_BABBI|nr:hypothetical protein, conserved [Babesia bigemina]CDR97942.1 hypothetical protein, conserved [Babesia bigemina]|eukprot:XP_012770128.1 hypothetical protein, conserved [Babesia bigemina]